MYIIKFINLFFIVSTFASRLRGFFPCLVTKTLFYILLKYLFFAFNIQVFVPHGNFLAIDLMFFPVCIDNCQSNYYQTAFFPNLICHFSYTNRVASCNNKKIICSKTSIVFMFKNKSKNRKPTLEGTCTSNGRPLFQAMAKWIRVFFSVFPLRLLFEKS